MNTKKMKNILILLLSISNIILLLNLAYREYSTFSSAENLHEELSLVLEDRGIILSDDVSISGEFSMSGYDVVFTEENMKKISDTLIGESQVLHIDDITHFESSTGFLQFQQNGSLSGEFAFLGTYPENEKETTSVITKLLIDFGISDTINEFTFEQTDDEIIATVTRQNNGHDIFNTPIEITLSKSGLSKIEGNFLGQAVKPKSFGEQISQTIPNALLESVNSIPSVREITEFRFGYLLIDGISGEKVLTPCFRCTADGIIYHFTADGKNIIIN